MTPPLRDGGALSDLALQERVITMLKDTQLFDRISWRLLGDLVRVEGLRLAYDVTDREPVDFLLLVVPERRLILVEKDDAHGRRDSPVTRRTVLTPGVYFASDPAVERVPGPRTIQPPPGQVVRYYALLRTTFKALPVQVLAGMDPAALETLLS